MIHNSFHVLMPILPSFQHFWEASGVCKLGTPPWWVGPQAHQLPGHRPLLSPACVSPAHPGATRPPPVPALAFRTGTPQHRQNTRFLAGTLTAGRPARSLNRHFSGAGMNIQYQLPRMPLDSSCLIFMTLRGTPGRADGSRDVGGGLHEAKPPLIGCF